MESFEYDKVRLSDRILNALELSVSQEDLQISELLANALELSMTRNTGGGEFIERRTYPEEVAQLLARLDELRAKKA